MRSLHMIFMRCKNACHFILAASVIVYVFSPLAFAGERQYKIEAAYLYSFFNYITWPGYETPQEMQKPVICVFGKDPLIPYLNYVGSKMAEERTLSIRAVTDEEAAEGCHIFFMRHRISYTMLSSLPPETLIVFKPDDPLDRGGMIELTEDEDRIAIKINQPQLEQHGFKVSSRLLDLAR